MGRKLVVILLVGLLFSLLLAAPRASAATDTEYLKYTIESEIQENKIMPPADSGMPPTPSAPPAPVTVSSPAVPPPSPSPPSVVVPLSPDFTISITPSSRTVTRGESTTYTVTVKSIGGYSGQVSLSVSGLPSGAGYSLPSRVGVPANGSAVAVLTVTTTTSTATGNSTITVTGTGSGTKSASAGLTVTAPAPPTPPSPSIPTPSLPTPKSYNFTDRTSDIPLNTPLGQQVQANWGNPTAIGAAINADFNQQLSTLNPSISSNVNSPQPVSTPKSTTASVVAKTSPIINSPPPSPTVKLASPPLVSPQIAALARAILTGIFRLPFFR